MINSCKSWRLTLQAEIWRISCFIVCSVTVKVYCKKKSTVKTESVCVCMVCLVVGSRPFLYLCRDDFFSASRPTLLVWLQKWPTLVSVCVWKRKEKITRVTERILPKDAITDTAQTKGNVFPWAFDSSPWLVLKPGLHKGQACVTHSKANCPFPSPRQDFTNYRVERAWWSCPLKVN